MFKTISAFLLALVLGASAVTSARAAEAITSFHSELTVNQDTSLSIKETIVFETDIAKHGIFRYIPLRYHQHGLNFRARVLDIGVKDERGQAYPYKRSIDEGSVFLKIGDPDITFSGKKTYIVEYIVENAIQMRDGRQSLIWDITGEGWQIPVLSTTAELKSPLASMESPKCYSGAFGQDDGLCQAEPVSDQNVVFTYDQPINYDQNMTIEALFIEPNHLAFPSAIERLGKTLADNIVVLLLALPGIGMFVWWWKKGRDSVFISTNVFNHDTTQPQTKHGLFAQLRTPMVYEPLRDLTPGEAGAILDERVDNQDVIAELIDLAHKQYLKIEKIDKKKLFGSETDYVFTQLKSSDSKLTAAQKYLLDSLFLGRDPVKLSDLKGTFYTHMAKVKEMIYQSLTDKGFFIGNPDKTRITAFIVGGIANGIGFIFLMGQLELGVYLAGVVFLIGAVISTLCAWFMPAKTAVGSNYSMQARGLRATIKRGAWREKIKEKHLFIEEVLPFAVALGVIDQLSRDMDTMNIKPPEYMASGFSSGNFTTAALVSSFTSSASSGMSYNPSSSSSGGGGSGGGGGGGGGGSW